MKEKDIVYPEFVHGNGMIRDHFYMEWLQDIKDHFRSSQMKTALRVNSEMLDFYWWLGREIIEKQTVQGWGNSVIKQLSLDLKESFGGKEGFSVTNLQYMRKWYLFYYEEVVKYYQSGNIIPKEICYQSGNIFQMPTIFSGIPWRQHTVIVSKSKSLDEAMFYVQKVIAESWSRTILEHKIENRLFQKQGQAITNFDMQIPTKESSMAKAILKDPYDFGVLNIADDYSEKELEDALSQNIMRFLMELGRGFAFVGRQMELKMSNGKSYFPDMIFYHIPQHRYVVVELKVVDFEPEFAGKLNFYVSAADELLKGVNDNPSIGLLICRRKDDIVVQWSFRDIMSPIGVAEYELKELVDRTIEQSLLNK